MLAARSWPRLERRINRWWTSERVTGYIETRRGKGVLIAPDGAVALSTAGERGLIDGDVLIATAHRIRRRDFEVLGAPVPRHGEWPWHTDWRWNHRWPSVHFRSYHHYGQRSRPYDVKFPWELSRLGFIPPLLQAATLDPQERWVESVMVILENWTRANPLAHTIIWDPMEASMRAISLVSALDIALSIAPESRVVLVLLRLLASHGEFIWRTVEYTDVRGNHYAANLVALLLIGLSLDKTYPHANRWKSHAASTIPREIEIQFCPDGVNFEKSLAYHRLVTELFVLSLIAMDRAAIGVPDRIRERLYAACTYSAACTRPDGLTPNVGDNDSARALLFDPVDSRDHRPLIGLGALLFRDGALKGAASRMPAAAPLLLGKAALADWEVLPSARLSGLLHFVNGGVVVVRDGDGFLWFDAGEVGLAGRGGHGHNDLLSFELVLDGVPLIVDAGSPVYSPDLETRNLFRSTAYHNGLRVDGQELAPLFGWWFIGNDACPSGVATAWEGGRGRIQAAHSGYQRLGDPVWHNRAVTFSPREGIFECTDTLRCQQRHRIERYLHLSPGVVVTIQGASARLACKGRAWSLSWDGSSKLTIEEGKVSPGYAVTEPASILVLEDTIGGDTEFRFTIRPIDAP